jgi:hypothetical protein
MMKNCDLELVGWRFSWGEKSERYVLNVISKPGLTQVKISEVYKRS